MAPETLAEAERLILRGDGLDTVCEALGCTRRTLERAFVAAHGTTPARWRKAQRGASEVLPPVFFRLPHALRRELEEAAAADGTSANAWVQALVVRALEARRARK